LGDVKIADRRGQMRILIVEDDQEKLSRVKELLLSCPGVDEQHLESVDNIMSAKRLLRTQRYALLVLDIAVPELAGGAVSPLAGLALLDEIRERDDAYQMPGYIVGITAYRDLIGDAAQRFAEDLWAVFEFDPAATEWKERLRRIVGHIGRLESDAALVDYESDLCIVTALYDPELTAVLALPWNWKDVEGLEDPTIYKLGIYMNAGRQHSVAAAHAPRMGMPAAAALTAKMITRFKPRYVAMVGITAGVSGECQVGDIIAADPGWDWGSGKRYIDEAGAATFSPAPHQIGLSARVRSRLVKLSQDQARLDDIQRGWSGKTPGSQLRLRVGPVASGAAVLQDPAYTGFVQQQHRKVIGIEMETYGVYAAAAETRTPEPQVFSLKSVCDFADERKNDDYQSYAAYTSAQALRIFVEEML
jgi:nucleoside phosphorylase/CheY-like chemotaxis protein